MTEKSEHIRRVVLLAEDDMEMRLLLSLALQKEGCSVIECRDGMHLLTQIEPSLNVENEVKHDLIVTDVRMPGMTGMQVVEGLTSLPGRPPVILITAFGEAETHRRAQQLGVAAVLDKPFEIEEFITVVREVLVAADTSKREKNRSRS
jgi:CheY-like chemotaxis protein